MYYPDVDESPEWSDEPHPLRSDGEYEADLVGSAGGAGRGGETPKFVRVGANMQLEQDSISHIKT